MTAANFGKDTSAGCYDDLAIGVIGEELNGKIFAGAVNVLYGSANGLTGSGSDFWNEDSPGISGDAEFNARFGQQVTAGHFKNTTSICGSSVSDLVIGVPGKTLASGQNGGEVIVLYGTSDGLTAAGSQYWSQDSPGVGEQGESGDERRELLAKRGPSHFPGGVQERITRSLAGGR